MNNELFETAACAASDLTARLSAELAQANNRLADAEARFRVAAARTTAGGQVIPLLLRRERTQCRGEVALLRQILAGVPSISGECHAESA